MTAQNPTRCPAWCQSEHDAGDIYPDHVKVIARGETFTVTIMLRGRQLTPDVHVHDTQWAKHTLLLNSRETHGMAALLRLGGGVPYPHRGDVPDSLQRYVEVVDTFAALADALTEAATFLDTCAASA